MKFADKAFTLVELIVVITILAVLWTIAFVSFQWYAKSSRDSARISDLKSIEKVLALHKIESWFFPNADNSVPVTYLSSMIWSQGTFGENARAAVKRISNIPVDPLTGTEYSYSTTYSKNEFEVGVSFEGQWLSGWGYQVLAWDRLGNSYVSGDYNGQLIQKEIGWVLYILAVPTIINANMWNVRYSDIVDNGSFALHGSNNLADSYSWTVFNPLGWWNIVSVNPANMVVFSWSISDLTGSDPSGRTALLTQLQWAYLWTPGINANTSSIWATMGIDINDPIAVNNYASSLVNNSLWADLTTNSTTVPTVTTTPNPPLAWALSITFPVGNQTVTCSTCY